MTIHLSQPTSGKGEALIYKDGLKGKRRHSKGCVKYAWEARRLTFPPWN
jgi:hypothetical protein